MHQNYLALPNTTVSCAQEKLRETTTEAERVAADLVCMKHEQIQRSGQKDNSEADTASAADLERATAETREMALRLQLAEEQVGGSYGPLVLVAIFVKHLSCLRSTPFNVCQCLLPASRWTGFRTVSRKQWRSWWILKAWPPR